MTSGGVLIELISLVCQRFNARRGSVNGSLAFADVTSSSSLSPSGFLLSSVPHNPTVHLSAPPTQHNTFFADQMEAGDSQTRPHFRPAPRLRGIGVGSCETRNQIASLPPRMPWKQERVLKDPQGGRGNADGSHLLRSAQNGTLPFCPHCTFIHHRLQA